MNWISYNLENIEYNFVISKSMRFNIAIPNWKCIYQHVLLSSTYGLLIDTCVAVLATEEQPREKNSYSRVTSSQVTQHWLQFGVHAELRLSLAPSGTIFHFNV